MFVTSTIIFTALILVGMSLEYRRGLRQAETFRASHEPVPSKGLGRKGVSDSLPPIITKIPVILMLIGLAAIMAQLVGAKAWLNVLDPAFIWLVFGSLSLWGASNRSCMAGFERGLKRGSRPNVLLGAGLALSSIALFAVLLARALSLLPWTG